MTGTGECLSKKYFFVIYFEIVNASTFLVEIYFHVRVTPSLAPANGFSGAGRLPAPRTSISKRDC
jgi:hypothetical protein